jgi:hypothetical protein
MIFAVFSLLSRGFTCPWFFRFSEVLNAVEQVPEVKVFSNLISLALRLFNRESDSVMSSW